MVVVLPQPLGPIMPRIAPWGSEKVMSKTPAPPPKSRLASLIARASDPGCAVAFCIVISLSVTRQVAFLLLLFRQLFSQRHVLLKTGAGSAQSVDQRRIDRADRCQQRRTRSTRQVRSAGSTARRRTGGPTPGRRRAGPLQRLRAAPAATVLGGAPAPTPRRPEHAGTQRPQRPRRSVRRRGILAAAGDPRRRTG